MEKILLFLFLLFVPTQLGKHFWPEWSKVIGMRVDYLSPTLYFLDILWVLLFLISKKKNKFSWSWGGLMLINVLAAECKWLAIYKWLRVWQMMWMLGYLSKRRRWLKENMRRILPGWIILESLLGLSQMIKGGSLGGWLYWLGERRFSFSTIGVAQISILGQGLIRAYGTFSHPNSLAGFLLVAVLWWFNYKKKASIEWWIVFWFGVLGIILTGSRMVWLISGIILIFNLKFLIFKRNKKRQWGFVLVLVGVFLMALAGVSLNYATGDFLGGWDSEGWLKRAGLNLAAIAMIRDYPWFGVGLGNFLTRLPAYQKNGGFFWLQPVHNCLLLIMSEIGVVGLLIFNFQ